MPHFHIDMDSCSKGPIVLQHKSSILSVKRIQNKGNCTIETSNHYNAQQ